MTESAAAPKMVLVLVCPVLPKGSVPNVLLFAVAADAALMC
jgi:hypothetical protein